MLCCHDVRGSDGAGAAGAPRLYACSSFASSAASVTWGREEQDVHQTRAGAPRAPWSKPQLLLIKLKVKQVKYHVRS